MCFSYLFLISMLLLVCFCRIFENMASNNEVKPLQTMPLQTLGDLRQFSECSEANAEVNDGDNSDEPQEEAHRKAKRKRGKRGGKRLKEKVKQRLIFSLRSMFFLFLSCLLSPFSSSSRFVSCSVSCTFQCYSNFSRN